MTDLDAIRDRVVLYADPEWRGEQPLFVHAACEDAAALLAEVDRLTEERDMAIAHDTQPYPTAWAYEQACRVRDEARSEVARLAAENAQYAGMVAAWPETWGGVVDAAKAEERIRIREAVRALPPECDYDPTALAGQPIGMFHCEFCGEMVIAGMAHPPSEFRGMVLMAIEGEE
jgi:hypothetical protein